jgi:hypothetical protein
MLDGRWDTGLGGGRDIMNKSDHNRAGATPRRQFDETYKRHAVDLTLHGRRTVKTVAKELEGFVRFSRGRSGPFLSRPLQSR